MCWLFHNWSAWREVKRGPLLTVKGNDSVGFYVLQERTCALCGKVQQHMASAII